MAASYGRSLVSLVCGLLAGRWALMVLGPVDFGLYGLIAGIVAFVGFFNSVLALAIGRFYAFEIGRVQKTVDAQSGMRDCRAWFSTALLLHGVIPTALFFLGLPLGLWAIAGVMTIPGGRLDVCQDIFVVSCIGAFVGMVTVPFQAMFTAKQRIAELTVYDVLSSLARVVCLYWMIQHPGDWLRGYAMLLAGVVAVPSCAIALQAVIQFPECRVVWSELFNWARIRALLKYAGWECFGSGALTLRSSGGTVLVNEYLGPVFNSAMAYSNSVACQTAALSQSLSTAFYPAITNAYGAGALDVVRRLSLDACRLGALLVALFAVPMILEARTVFELWLRTPPEGTVELCVYQLVGLLVERVTSGSGLAINASGRIGRYQLLSGILLMLGFPLSWGLLFVGCGVHGIGIALLISNVFNGMVKIFFVRQIVGIGVGAWFCEVLWPVLRPLLIALLLGGVCVGLLDRSYLRLLWTGSVTVPVLAWFCWRDSRRCLV